MSKVRSASIVVFPAKSDDMPTINPSITDDERTNLQSRLMELPKQIEFLQLPCAPFYRRALFGAQKLRVTLEPR
jgi:hypothetical protein